MKENEHALGDIKGSGARLSNVMLKGLLVRENEEWFLYEMLNGESKYDVLDKLDRSYRITIRDDMVAKYSRYAPSLCGGNVANVSVVALHCNVDADKEGRVQISAISKIDFLGSFEITSYVIEVLRDKRFPPLSEWAHAMTIDRDEFCGRDMAGRSMDLLCYAYIYQETAAISNEKAALVEYSSDHDVLKLSRNGGILVTDDGGMLDDIWRYGYGNVKNIMPAIIRLRICNIENADEAINIRSIVKEIIMMPEDNKSKLSYAAAESI